MACRIHLFFPFLYVCSTWFTIKFEWFFCSLSAGYVISTSMSLLFSARAYIQYTTTTKYGRNRPTKFSTISNYYSNLERKERKKRMLHAHRPIRKSQLLNRRETTRKIEAKRTTYTQAHSLTFAKKEKRIKANSWRKTIALAS